MRAHQPSATARLIARSTAALAADPLVGHLVPPRAAELCAQFVAPSRSWLARLSRADAAAPVRLLRRTLRAAAERLTIPGISLHYALRKRFLEETARTALEKEGFRQVVVLGAGLDTLALRLHETFPAVRFVEIDHPATQQFKTQAFARRGLRVGSNLRFLPLDLGRQSLDQLARPNDFDADDRRTLFIAEGLLMYLTPGEVDALFEFVGRRGGAGSRFAFTYMESDAGGRAAFRNSTRAVKWWLRWRGEPFKWSLRPAQLPPFLAAHALSPRGELVTADTLRRRYLDDPQLSRLPLAVGEHLCVADSV
ncbi:MAG: class I SAM-dependent methyltransferase [Pyrinomonadaceae bacterium]